LSVRWRQSDQSGIGGRKTSPPQTASENMTHSLVEIDVVSKFQHIDLAVHFIKASISIAEPPIYPLFNQSDRGMSRGLAEAGVFYTRCEIRLSRTSSEANGIQRSYSGLRNTHTIRYCSLSYAILPPQKYFRST